MDDVYVLNREDFNTIGIVDSYESTIWTDRYSDCGDFEIYVPSTIDHLNLLKKDRILWIEESEHQMFIEDIQMDSDIEMGNYFRVTGRSLEIILKWRIVWVQTNLSGNLQNGIEKLLNDNIIKPSITQRKISNFIFKRSTDPEITSLKFEGQFTGDVLFDAIKKICDSANIGFKVTISEEKQFVFELYKGVDRSYSQISNPYVVFSKNFDNIVNSRYIDSNSNYRNVTLVAGEGEGLERRTLVVGNNKNTGLDRRELFTDARDISSTDGENTLTDSEYDALLKQRGEEKLLENKVIKTFDGQTDTTRMYRYGEDFFMGDIVQLENDYTPDTESRVRIVEYIYSTSKNGDESYPTFEVLDEEKEV